MATQSRPPCGLAVETRFESAPVEDAADRYASSSWRHSLAPPQGATLEMYPWQRSEKAANPDRKKQESGFRFGGEQARRKERDGST